MAVIQDRDPGYPPPLPLFEQRDGYMQAFYTESYARELMKEKGEQVR